MRLDGHCQRYVTNHPSNEKPRLFLGFSHHQNIDPAEILIFAPQQFRYAFAAWQNLTHAPQIRLRLIHARKARAQRGANRRQNLRFREAFA